MDTSPEPRQAASRRSRQIPSRVLASALAASCSLAVLLAPSLARADLLTGGLLGRALRGDEFTGPRVIDLLAIGLILFVLLRLLLGTTRKTGQTVAPPPESPEPYDDDRPPLDAPTGKPNMYTNAQATWEALKTPPPKGAPPASPTSPDAASLGQLPPGATPDQEFLAGAKVAYGRILASMARRDFDDLTHFATAMFLAQLRNSLPASPQPAPDILLVDASLAGQRQEEGRTVMDVDYRALVREPGASQNTERLERWRFVRDAATPGANWLLDGMERR